MNTQQAQTVTTQQLQQRLKCIDEKLECLQCERAAVHAQLRAVWALEGALSRAALVGTIVERIRVVAETDAGGALGMANAQLLPWRHGLQPAYFEQVLQALPEYFPSRWTRADARTFLDAVAAALACDVAMVVVQQQQPL